MGRGVCLFGFTVYGFASLSLFLSLAGLEDGKSYLSLSLSSSSSSFSSPGLSSSISVLISGLVCLLGSSLVSGLTCDLISSSSANRVSPVSLDIVADLVMEMVF